MELTNEQREAFFNHIISKKIRTTCSSCGTHQMEAVNLIFTLPSNEKLTDDKVLITKGGAVPYFALRCPNCLRTDFFEACDALSL